MKRPQPFRSSQAGSGLPYDRLVLDFESLGDNCEFGLVQRFAGAEPLGLFRFSSTTIPALVHALDTDLVEYGRAGDLLIDEGPLGYLFCPSRRYGFAYNTGDFAADAAADKVLAREEKKVRYLKERFLADLASGEKILVRKSPAGETLDEVRLLVRALMRHGPVRLLRVLASDGERYGPGAAAWCDDRIMEGYVGRFAPYENVPEIGLEDWMSLCRNAHGLAQGGTGPTPLPARSPDLLPDLLPDPLGGRTDDVAIHARAADGAIVATRVAHRLRADGLYCLSAWIWLPAGFRAERIAMAFGRLRLAHVDADLSRTESWQRVWAAARIGRGLDEVPLTLVCDGPPGERFWSTAWRLEEAPIPDPSIPAPSARIGPAP